MTECETCKVPMVIEQDHYWADLQETFWRCPECKKTFVTYRNQQKSHLKRIVLNLFAIVQHNKEHYITLHVAGENVYACSRCLGAYITGLICWFLFGVMYFLNVFPLSFLGVFAISFLLGSVTLIDYVTVDVFHLRKGSNRVRFIAGSLLGLSAMLYFWLLPASWLFRIGTLIIYNLLAISVALISVRMRKVGDTTSVSSGQRG